MTSLVYISQQVITCASCELQYCSLYNRHRKTNSSRAQAYDQYTSNETKYYVSNRQPNDQKSVGNTHFWSTFHSCTHYCIARPTRFFAMVKLEKTLARHGRRWYWRDLGCQDIIDNRNLLLFEQPCSWVLRCYKKGMELWLNDENKTSECPGMRNCGKIYIKKI